MFKGSEVACRGGGSAAADKMWDQPEECGNHVASGLGADSDGDSRIDCAGGGDSDSHSDSDGDGAQCLTETDVSGVTSVFE